MDEDIEKFDTSSWSSSFKNFSPLRKLPVDREIMISNEVDKNSSELDVLMAFLPQKFWDVITAHTNERLDIFSKNKGKKKSSATPQELQTVFGICLVTCYNKLPHIKMYWSKKPSLGNDLIKSAMARDRFLCIFSKLYFNSPEKPEGVSKLFYLEKVLPMFNSSFQRMRSNSVHQSIDEMMVKFLGRLSFKQYQPLKPIKRGVKLWDRCDALTGYVYEVQVYCGKDTTTKSEGTLGERIVQGLLKSIPRDEVDSICLCFDRFFTSLELLRKMPCCGVGTIQKNRKNLPKLNTKLDKYSSEFQHTADGITLCRWQDTKDVLVVSNCHSSNITTVKRTSKTGTKNDVSCPEAISFYNKYMGGVDHAGQMVTLYDFDRKTNKWWRRVFFKLFLIAVFNSFVVFKELKGNDKLSFIDFLVPLAEQLIAKGTEGIERQRGRPSKRKSLGKDHLIIVGDIRRRCVSCTAKGFDLKTDTRCIACDQHLCKNCFYSYHVNM